MSTRRMIATAALAAAALGLIAAAPVGARPHGSYSHHYGADGSKFEGRGALRGELGGRMMRELGLTEAQRDKLFELRHAAQPAMREKMKDVRKASQALREAATASEYDAQRVRQLADERGRLLADLTVMRIETEQKVRAVLTPEQRQKLAQLRGERRERSGRR